MKDQSPPAETGDTPRDGTPREETASGETPRDGAASEDAPRDETPRAQARDDGPPRDEAPGDDTSAEGTSGNDTSAEDASAEDTSTDETAAEEPSGKKPPGKDAPGDDSQRRDEGAPLGVRSWRPGKYAIAAMGAAAAVAAVSTALVLTGGDSGTAAMAKSAEPPTVEKLASALQCEADIQKKVEDYRLGVCKADKTQYTFVTFKDNRAKRGWLDFSKDYGGTYLVGSRWIVVTDAPSKLGPIQGKWGGTVERGADHGQGHGRH